MNKRPVVLTAVTGTVLIAAGAFWLSFTSLADLARRSGIHPSQAWAWPLIVDGIIVVATVAVVAVSSADEPHSAWYPWSLLFAGASVSVVANALHAAIAADDDVPHSVAASVAAVPPVVLLAITHLTVQLTRTSQPAPTTPVAANVTRSVAPIAGSTDESTGAVEVTDPRSVAADLRGRGMSNRAIARHLGVHPSTVGRWLPATNPAEVN